MPGASFFYRIKNAFSTDRTYAKRVYAHVGYYPKNTDLFKIAFTHRSAQMDLGNGAVVNNERLEFLGDAVLDSIIADYLFIAFPNKDEGFLTQMRSKIVKREYLNMLSQKMGIDQLLVSKTSSNTPRKNIYGDALEALIGAIYLDGGYQGARKYIARYLIPKYINLQTLMNEDSNYKSQLLEWSQKNKLELVYQTSADPNRSERFVASIRLNNEIIGVGTGSSKKEAEQHASEKALFKVTAPSS